MTPPKTYHQNVIASGTKKINDFKVDCLYKLDDLKLKHLAEIQKFNDYWASEEILVRYSSPSPELQDLYHQEEKLVEFKEYAQAANIRQYRISLEEKETKESQEKLLSDAKSKLRILEKKHQYELECLEAYFQEGIRKLQYKKENDAIMFQKRLIKLNKDHENPIDRAPLPASWRFSEMGTQTPMAVTTPRTRVKFANFKKTKPIVKLELHGITSRPSTCIQRVRIQL